MCLIWGCKNLVNIFQAILRHIYCVTKLLSVHVLWYSTLKSTTARVHRVRLSHVWDKSLVYYYCVKDISYQNDCHSFPPPILSFALSEKKMQNNNLRLLIGMKRFHVWWFRSDITQSLYFLVCLQFALVLRQNSIACSHTCVKTNIHLFGMFSVTGSRN